MKKKTCRKKIRTFIFILSLALTFVMAVGANFSDASEKDKVFRWRMQDNWGPETVYHKANQKLMARIDEMSGGRLSIKLFPSGSLVPPTGTFDAIRKGVFEGHITAPAYWAGKIPATTILCTVPSGIDNVDDFNIWFWQKGGIQIAREAYAAHGLYCVGPGIIHENVQFIKKNKPVRTLADYKGLKIRTMPGLQSEIMKALGASPVFLPMPEVFTALQTGVLDAVSGYTIVGWRDVGIHEITQYVLTPGYLQPSTNLDVVVNLKDWEKLPNDLQAIFECAVREWGQYWFATDYLENKNALKDILDKGLELVRLPDEDVEKIREISLPIIDAYAEKDPLAKKAWESQKDYLRYLGKIK